MAIDGQECNTYLSLVTDRVCNSKITTCSPTYSKMRTHILPLEMVMSLKLIIIFINIRVLYALTIWGLSQISLENTCIRASSKNTVIRDITTRHIFLTLFLWFGY